MQVARIYQNTPLKVNNEVILDDYARHHLTKVLRFSQGQNIVLFNGDGNDYLSCIISVGKVCRLKIVAAEANLSESKLNLTLAQGLVKGNKMDFLIQKAVELGVNKIVPIISQYCVVRPRAEKWLKHQQHWQKIVIAACQQSGRSVVPEMAYPMSFCDFLNEPMNNGFVLHQRAKTTLLTLKPRTKAVILIGPEGGLSADEIKQAIAAGYQQLLLSERVLRAETASLAAIANLQLLWGS